MEQKEKKSFMQKIKKLLTAKSVGGVIVRIIILLAIPYAYLLLCGLIFDKWLRLYQATTFIFISLCILYLIAIVLCVLTVKWYLEAKKGINKPHKKASHRKAAPAKTEKAEKPAEEKTVTAEPVAEQKPAEAPAAEKQIAPQPVYEQPKFEQPVYEQPKLEQSLSELESMAESLKQVEETNKEE